MVLVEKPGQSTAISFGHPIDVHRGSKEFYALWVANSWLGEHRNSASHLYQVIRAARGLNYGDYSYIEAFPEGGRCSMPPTNVGRRSQSFEVWIRTLPNEQAHFALRAAIRPDAKVVVIGAGFIGAEVASSALELGADVTVVEALSPHGVDNFSVQLVAAATAWSIG